MDYIEFFKWQVSLGKNSRFLPKVTFSKREGIFTLYFYPSKDSLICRCRFFYDGGDVLPVIGKWEERNVDGDGGAFPIDLPAHISKYFSFNVTNLRKAIHRRGMSKTNGSSSTSKASSSSGSSSTIEEKSNAPYRSVRLEPRTALINKDFFGIKQKRSGNCSSKKKSINWNDFLKVLVKEKADLYQLLLWSASNYDFSRFDEFASKVNEHLKANGCQPCSYKTLFSFFKNFVLDLQSNLC